MKKFLFLTMTCLFAHTSFSQCSGFQIVANKNSICAPDIIRFQVLNPVAGSTYEWNVGNGIVFGADTLYSFFTTPRTINATVKITLPGGTVCTVTENAIAVVNPVPVPSFTSSDVLLCYGPDSIELTDVTPNSASRSWVVQGTNYSNTTKSFKHKFVSSGTKKISLIVTDNNGCKGVKEFIDTIQIFDDPNFSFAADNKSGCAPLDVNLSLTNNPALSPYTKTYAWSFPGNASSTDNSATPSTRTYTTAGKYPVGLQVTVSNGCTYVIAQDDTITVGDTVILGLTASEDTVCVGEQITFNQTTTGLLGNVIWNFIGITQNVVSKNNSQAVFKPSSRGDVGVLLGYNNNGCYSAKYFPKVTRVNGVEANFSSANNFHCLIPHTVDLDNQSDTLDANTLSYKWRVLDGSTEVFTSTDPTPSFTFNTLPGIYDVQLIATGDNGCIDTTTTNQFIYQDSIRLDFDVFPKVACVGQEIDILNSTRPSTYLFTDSFSWRFFDLNGIDILDSLKEQSPKFIYDSVGFYDIEVIGFNDAGCRDTLRKNGIIEVIDSELEYSLSDSIVCLGDRIFVSGNSKPVGANINYNWNFRHKESGVVFVKTGPGTSVLPTLIGDYEVVVSQNIGGGCVSSDTTNVFINGVLGNIKLDTSYGCAPLQVNPEIEIIKNEYKGFTDIGYSYFWSAVPSSGITEEYITTDTPSFGFIENGDYSVNLRITNPAGCVSNIESKKVLTGVRAGFNISDNRICKGDSLELWNESFNGVTGVDWKLFPDAAYTAHPVDSNLIRFAIAKPGSYSLRQIVTNNGNCYDTLFQPFEIIETIANFVAVDSFLKCAPIYAEFESRSSNADTLIWDFGVGDSYTTTSISAGTIYQRNSGWSEGYDIKLIAKNSEGCTDTTIKEDYLVVAGPTPAFEMENFEGCEPLNVRFTDKSIDGKTFYLNYNDGSPLDSSKVGDYIGAQNYTIQSQVGMRQTVMPSIIVYDSVGCAAVFEPADSIVIFRKPHTQSFFDNGIELCSPFNLVFEDTGSFTNSRQWSFDGVDISTKAKDSTVLKGAGAHELQLISSNSNNCKDTMVQPIGVFETPVVTFTKDDTICLNKVALFDGDVQTTNPSNYFRWNFGEPGTTGNINTTDLDPTFTYASGGTKNVKLFAGLNNGCGDSAEITIIITDEQDIDVPEIDYISFTDNYELEVIYNKSTNAKFRNYFLNSGAGEIEIFEQEETSYQQSFSTAPLVSDCYTLSVGDYCDVRGDNSTAHCFIVLSASSTQPYINELNWTPYAGWSSVLEYNIYRKDDRDVFVKIATVDGATTSYLDEKLCDEEFEYYVSAVHPTETWESKSYTVSQRPFYINNDRLSSVRNVTVVGDNEIKVTWDSSDFSEFSNYILYKYETNFDNLISEIELTETSYIDRFVSTNEYSYIYQIVEQDRCEYVNTPDKEGKSILLTGRYNEGSDLSWTKYENWASGVKEYNIEIDKNEGFTFVNKNANNDFGYLDKKLYREITGEYCYRVFGVSNDRDTSYSNTVCMIGKPTVFVPNAFTPNGDGLNDKFNPISLFIKQGELEEINGFLLTVFNRWGEKVYETNNPADGWDGSYRGAKCPPGAYAYVLKATGLDNVKIYKDGSISIIR